MQVWQPPFCPSFNERCNPCESDQSPNPTVNPMGFNNTKVPQKALRNQGNRKKLKQKTRNHSSSIPRNLNVAKLSPHSVPFANPVRAHLNQHGTALYEPPMHSFKSEIIQPTELSLLERLKKEISYWFATANYRLPNFTCAHKVLHSPSRQMLA